MFINMLGLILGLSIFILMSLYVVHERSYDNFNSGKQNIYRVLRGSDKSDRYYLNPEPLKSALISEIPSIMKSSRLLYENWGKLVTAKEKTFFSNDVKAVDKEGLQIFDFNILNGDITDFKYGSVILSTTEAMRIFGTTDVIGESIQLDGTGHPNVFTVTGVFEDYPGNSHLEFSIVFEFDSYLQFSQPASIGNWSNANYHLYLELVDGTNQHEIEAKLLVVMDKSLGSQNKDDLGIQMFLQPLTSIHLDAKGVSFKTSGSHERISIVSFLAIFILLIACANYSNLSIAHGMARSREVGIRKVSGARQSALIGQFLLETGVLVLFSLGLSLFVAVITIPLFSSYVDRELTADILLNPQLIGIISLTTLVTALVSGIYPALMLSKYQPSQVLKGRFINSENGKLFRNGMVLIQFIISGILVVSALTIQQQMKFLMSKDPGFTTANIVNYRLRDIEMKKPDNRQYIKNQLLKIPGINEVSFSNSLPNRANGSMGRMLKDETGENSYEFGVLVCDEDFLSMYEISLLEGRNFSSTYNDQNSYLINEKGAKLLGLDDPVGKIYLESGKDTIRIVGVVKDFHFKSLHREIDPFRFVSDKVWPTWINYLSIKLSDQNSSETIANIDHVLIEFSDRYPLEYAFFEDIYRKQYEADSTSGDIVQFFTICAILLASLGLIGLIRNTINLRVKELAIRKVLGATLRSITWLMGSYFNKVVFGGFVAGGLIAYFLMDRWLTEFAYRVEIGVSTYLLAGIIITIILWSVLSSLVWSNHKTNLAETLRNE